MSSETTTFQYIIVHQACKNRPGVLAVQASHAANECLRPEDVPVRSDNRLCVLEAPSSESLELVATVLQGAGIHHVVIREPDAPWNNSITAIGVAPFPVEWAKEKVKPLLSNLSLLR